MINFFKEKQRIRHKKSEIKKLFSSSIVDLSCAFNDSTQLEGYNVIGKNVNICSAKVGLGTIIGNNSQFSNCQIGRFCSLGSNICVVSATHPIDFVSTNPCFYRTVNNYPLGRGNVVFDEFLKCDDGHFSNIGNDVWIGNNVLIKGGVSIGDGAIIAMGAVVTKDVLPYAIVGGVPAKIIKYRFEKTIIDKLLAIKWWEWELPKIISERELFNDISIFLDRHNQE